MLWGQRGDGDPRSVANSELLIHALYIHLLRTARPGDAPLTARSPTPMQRCAAPPGRDGRVGLGRAADALNPPAPLGPRARVLCGQRRPRSAAAQLFRPQPCQRRRADRELAAFSSKSRRPRSHRRPRRQADGVPLHPTPSLHFHLVLRGTRARWHLVPWPEPSKRLTCGNYATEAPPRPFDITPERPRRR